MKLFIMLMVAQQSALTATMDSLARATLREEGVAGFSVAVMARSSMLLERGYGLADIGLRAAATESTRYRFLGPTLAAAVMQQVDADKLALEAPASKYLPEFPWQGRHVTIRQLMDATSGLPDFHYLGDEYLQALPIPKSVNEVTDLFAGKPFTHEPGSRFQWTISGFHLAGLIVERVTRQLYSEYIRDNIFARAALTNTFYCADREVIPLLARGYELDGRELKHVTASATTVPFIATTCTTAGEAVALTRALRTGQLMSARSYSLLRDAGTNLGRGPEHRVIGMRAGHEEGHRWIGERGTLLGFSSAVMDFPEDSLTVAVLTNTNAGQVSALLARNLARVALGLPPVAKRTPQATSDSLRVAPLRAESRAAFLGTYVAAWNGAAGPYSNWKRTFNIFERAGRLMIHSPGEVDEPLLYQGDDTFAIASWPAARIKIVVGSDNAAQLLFNAPGFSLAGSRVNSR